MFNSNSGSRTGATEAVSPRPEPREPRAESRPPVPRGPEARASDTRTPEARAAEIMRAPEPRVPDVRALEAAQAQQRASVLGPSLKFRGELSAQEDLIVQGSVEGSITHTQTLTVGIDGTVKGDIRARIIIVDGKLEGNLYASESVSVRATARVKGNVFAPRVAISEGAFFQGQVDMAASAAAVQEHTARMRQAGKPVMPQLNDVAVDQVLSGT